MSFEGVVEIESAERTRRNQILRSLLNSLEAHAEGEGGHAERVAVYAVSTGEKLGMSDEELLTLRYAAEMHDIGKLLIDPALLLADRALEPQERALMERHVVFADEVLPRESFLEEARPLIRHHHERWSGEGYPSRLAGSDIPLGARIIGAAEAMDVMLEGAPWRAPFPEEAAVAAMQGLAGSWFDPDVVDALLEIRPLVQPIRAIR